MSLTFPAILHHFMAVARPTPTLHLARSALHSYHAIIERSRSKDQGSSKENQAAMSEDTTKPVCPVSSHNEWDPLEEVIVGRLEHAMLPDATIINRHTFPPSGSSFIQEILAIGGVPYPPEMIEAAQQDLDRFLGILSAEGITVRRPDIVDYQVPIRTPDWKTPSGSSSTNPRDPFLVVGDQIIEAPMADRSRYFEAWAYRSLFVEYFRNGARWVAAPKPQLVDAQYQR